jgi:4-hydroxybenzoate polyprenyltransferase
MVYFTLPANLLIYGVNDIFDFATDLHNAKKGTYEVLLQPALRKKVWVITLLLNVLFLAPLMFLELQAGGFLLTTSLLGFLFFGVFYSAPPIRAKAIPFLDSFFNILYVFPGIAAYLAGGGDRINIPVLAAATLWCMAMHAFSAVPDIAADRKAKLATIATTLGARRTLIFCASCYALATVLVYPSLGFQVTLLGAGYVGVMLGALKNLGDSKAATDKLFATYKSFPLLNTAAGMVLTLLLLRQWFS